MMPTSCSDKYLLEYILKCIGRIEEYTEDRREVFFDSPMVQDAVARNLQTLAESTQRLSNPVKERYAGIPWRGFSGFRNVIAHRYLSLDLDVVWNVVEQHLPDLKSSIEEILSSSDSENDGVA